MEFYFYKKHIQLSVMKENGKSNSVDLFFIHTVLLTLVVFDYVLEKNKICVNSQTTDKHGRILILDVTIDGSEYILVNICNANTQIEQLKVLNDLSELTKKVNITHGKQTVLASEFNLLFDSNLEAKGDKPILKEKSFARMIELKEEYDLCDIWKIRNPLEKSFNFNKIISQIL